MAPWHWLMGGHAALAPVWRAYHVYVGRAANGDIPHTEALVLIDRRGYERSGYLYPFNQGFVTHDLGVLGRERRASMSATEIAAPAVVARAGAGARLARLPDA